MTPTSTSGASGAGAALSAQPGLELTDARLKPAIERIKAAMLGQSQGGDMWLCAAMAAQDILGGIVYESTHRFGGKEAPGDWKRMPPALRAAIAKATGVAP